jgi:hypothetical protein
MPWDPLLRAISDHVVDPYLWSIAPVDAGIAVIAIAGSTYLIATRRFALGIYGLLLIFLPLSTGTLVSVTRYASVNVPMFIALGLVAGRVEWIRTAILIAFATLLGFEAALFVLGVHSVA